MHARLKNEFTQDEKCYNLMSWLISDFPFSLYNCTSRYAIKCSLDIGATDLSVRSECSLRLT